MRPNILEVKDMDVTIDYNPLNLWSLIAIICVSIYTVVYLLRRNPSRPSKKDRKERQTVFYGTQTDTAKVTPKTATVTYYADTLEDEMRRLWCEIDNLELAACDPEETHNCSANESLSSTSDTSRELHRQQEQLAMDRCNHMLDKMDDDLKQSKRAKAMRVISSPFRGIINYFARDGKKKDKASAAPQRIQVTKAHNSSSERESSSWQEQRSSNRGGCESSGNTVVDDNLDHIEALRELKRVTLEIGNQLNYSIGDRKKDKTSAVPQRAQVTKAHKSSSEGQSSSWQEQRSSNRGGYESSGNTVVDDNLDHIEQAIREMNRVALEFSKIINQMNHSIATKVTDGDSRIIDLNRKISRKIG